MLSESREHAAPADRRADKAFRPIGIGAAQGGDAALGKKFEVDRAADQPDVCQRLRKIAEEPAAFVHLLGIQADIIGARKQRFE